MKAIILLLTFLYVTYGFNPPIVDLPSLGKVEGGVQRSYNGQNFYAFEGIPYALPPTGKRRFKKPVPSKPWNGTWQARTVYKCMQYTHLSLLEEDRLIGDEDCLYVNVYTPILDKEADLDVIVYIHGGAFMYLYGTHYGPSYIMDRKVVYINLNYRLGPLGFLSTEDDIVPGNNGIRDQILALEWIKRNVKYFGGNPNSVTIFGMSAGGASVHVHYLSPKSKGLFKRGLSQSGTALNPWVLMEQPLAKTKKIASSLGCPGEETEKIVDCLRKRPARQIVASVKDFQPWLYNPFSPFGVVVDTWSSDPVLPDHPYNLVKQGKINDLVWIASQTNFEGLYPGAEFLQDKYLNDLDTRWNDLIPFILDYNYTVDLDMRDAVSQKIRQHYLGDRKVDRSSFIDFIKILSHRLFDIGIQKTAKLQASSSKSSVYFYLFTYRGAHAWYESSSERLDEYGASHAEDTAYILKTPVDTASTEDDRSMVDTLLDMLVSFAKSGVPATRVEWTPVSKNSEDKILALKIDSPKKLSMETVQIEDETFWDSLPIKENEQLLYGTVKDEL